MNYRRLVSYTEELQKRVEKFFDVELDARPMLDGSGYMVIPVEGSENRDKIIRKLQNLGMQYMLDDTDPNDLDFFIIRINDARLT